MQIYPEPFRVFEMLQEVADSLESLAQAKSISLRFPDERLDWTLDADRIKVAQILVNLIGNAIKFTPEKPANSTFVLSRPAFVTKMPLASKFKIPASAFQRRRSTSSSKAFDRSTAHILANTRARVWDSRLHNAWFYFIKVLSM